MEGQRAEKGTCPAVLIKPCAAEAAELGEVGEAKRGELRPVCDDWAREGLHLSRRVQVVVIPVQQHGSARGAHAGVALGPNRRSGCELHEADLIAQGAVPSE